MDRTPDQGEVHCSAGIPGLVAVLDAAVARHCVATVEEEPEVIWGQVALAQVQGQDQDQDRRGRDQDRDRRGQDQAWAGEQEGWNSDRSSPLL